MKLLRPHLILTAMLLPGVLFAASILVHSLELRTDEARAIGIYEVKSVSTNMAERMIECRLTDALKEAPPTNHVVHFSEKGIMPPFHTNDHVLVFFPSSKQPTYEAWHVINLSSPASTPNSGQLAVDVQFEVIVDSSNILSCVKDRLRHPHSNAESTRIPIPFESKLFYKSLRQGSVCYLAVPLDLAEKTTAQSKKIAEEHNKAKEGIGE